jgi:hypothetical protein
MTPRQYASTLRTEQAAATRRRVIQAALELFSRDGYGATSLARIAEAAEVSVETVRSVGPKRFLLERATVLATFGDTDEPSPTDLAEAAARHGVSIETPAEWVATMSSLIARLNSEAAGIFRALSSAAVDDPEVDAIWRAQQRQVREAWRGYFAWLDSKGWISTQADRDELATTGWILTLADTYTRMEAAGYDEDAYRRWLEASLRRLLFDP